MLDRRIGDRTTLDAEIAVGGRRNATAPAKWTFIAFASTASSSSRQVLYGAKKLTRPNRRIEPQLT